MRIVSIALALALSLSFAGNLLAADKEKGQGDKAKTPEFSGPLGFLNGLELTAEQKSKLADLMKEYKPKLDDAQKAIESIITPEQKKAGDKAAKEAKEAGKTPREVAEAARDAAKPTEEQKAKLIEAIKKAGPIRREFFQKAMNVLTDAQKEQLQKMWQERMEKMKNSQKKPAGAS